MTRRGRGPNGIKRHPIVVARRGAATEFWPRSSRRAQRGEAATKAETTKHTKKLSHEDHEEHEERQDHEENGTAPVTAK
jgi:hypothetical protein